MDIEKLLEQLKNFETCAYGYHINGEVLGMDCSDFEQVMADAATALSTLQDENTKLRDSRDRWKKCAEQFSAGVDQRDKETEKLRAENEKLKDQLYDGEGVNLIDYWMQQAKIEENGHKNCQAENEQLRAELERVKRERDAIEQDFRVFAKQWWEEDSGFPCRWCKFEDSGSCEWKVEHPNEKICAGRAFEWRGPQKED